MAGPDLSFAKSTIESLMDDACVIWQETTAGEVFNAVTGLYTDPVPTHTVIYTGPCLFHPQQALDRQTLEGGAAISLKRYEASVPIAVVNLRVGHIMKVTASLRDPSAVGREFRITEVFAKTFAISRKFKCEEREVILDRP